MAFADGLEAALEARGFDVLIDRQEIYAFEDWWKRIEALIGRADTVVFVLSPDAVKSDVALKEIAYAASLNKRFAPIACRRVEDSAIPDALRRLNFIFFDDAERFEESADKLADALETDINWIRQHTEYGEAERRWSSAGRPSGLLLQAPTLELAEYWLTSRPRNAPEPTEEVRAYVIESRKRARATQRIWRGVLASTFTLLVGIILGLVGWINQSYIAAQWRWYSIQRPFLAANVWPHVLTAEAERALSPGHSFKECATACSTMVVVPAGNFMMGSPATANKSGQEPQHRVVIAKPFAVSEHETTFTDWDACATYGDCDPNISMGLLGQDGLIGRGQQPVINVTWNDAKRYAAWLSRITGKPYRLLSEAEYEYAARAGTQTIYPWGDDVGKMNANCDGCDSPLGGIAPAPVNFFGHNQFGLYDMVGNVWEWVEDCGHFGYVGAPVDGSPWADPADFKKNALKSGDVLIRCDWRMIRGGSFASPPEQISSASRGTRTKDERNIGLGFRVARTLDVP
jgi:formylglycine-generating enzyme required for sulfatase activity